LIDGARVNQVGFDDAQSLLPNDGRSFGGYRMLQEYFAFPQRFMFAALSGIQTAVQNCDSSTLEIMILLQESNSALVDVLTTDNFALYCTPVINLFERRADRIRLTPQTLEHHVLPDRTRPMDFEVWGVAEARGIGESADESEAVFPLYASKDPGAGSSDCYFVTQREPRLLSTKQRRMGTRSSGYVGSEVFLSVVSASGEPAFDRFKQLDVTTLCTNRDLPMQGSWGQGATDFDLQSGAPVTRVRCLDKPSTPRRSFADGETNWRLINLLSVNYLSLVGEGAGAESMRELLRVFCAQGDATASHQLDGLVAVDSKGIAARLPVPGPQTFGRGLEVTLTLDETAFERGDAFLFGAVLERFFGRHVTLNSFTRTRVVTKQRNEIMQWPTRAGHRRTL
jgi:type VI secretion system protein ImpG